MKEQTLVIIKHDGVLRGLIGEIIKRFENIGLKITAMKMVWANDRLAENHYQITEEWEREVGEKTRKAMAERRIVMKETNSEIAKRVQQYNKEFLKEGPIIAMVLEGNHVIELTRKLVGSTESKQALPGTIRGDFGFDSYMTADNQKRNVRNLVHASSSESEAQREIALWFTKEELHEYKHKKERGIY